MRTNIEIDDRLMAEAMRSCRCRTKRATVESALRLLIQTKTQSAIGRLRGIVDWQRVSAAAAQGLGPAAAYCSKSADLCRSMGCSGCRG